MKWRTIVSIGVVFSMFGGTVARALNSEPGELIVRFSTSQATLPSGLTQAPVEDITFIVPALADSLEACSVDLCEQLNSGGTSSRPGQVDMSQVYRLSVPITADLDLLADRISSFPGVEDVGVNEIGEWFTIQDPRYPDQWYLNNTGQDDKLPSVDAGAEEAWNTTLGSSQHRVWVYDTGIDHGDINEETLHIISPGNFEHGTQVAGILAAVANTSGVRGIAPVARICDLQGQITSSDFASLAMPFMQNQNTISSLTGRVLSISGGFFSETDVILGEMRNYFLSGDYGGLIVAAGGNSNVPTIPVPARIEQLSFAVGAVEGDGKPYSQGTFGPHLDVAAPGGRDVVTTKAGGGISTDFGGTSAATPVVAGIASMLLDVNPDLFNVDIMEIIQRTSIDVPPVGYDTMTGHGRVHAGRAVRYIASPRVVVTDTLTTTQVAVVDTSDFYEKNFENLGWVLDDPSLPDELTTYVVKRVDLEGTATFGSPFLLDSGSVWVRFKDGLAPGWRDEQPINAVKHVGQGRVEATTTTSATLGSSVYALYDTSDTSFVAYVPLHPDSVEIPYTAVLGAMDDPPAVTVLSPNGGEHWSGGTREIKWTMFDDGGIDSASVYYSINDGESWPYELATGVTPDTTWMWSLTGSPGHPGSSSSRVAVVVYDAEGDRNYDMSDAKFTVVTATQGEWLAHLAPAEVPFEEAEVWSGESGGIYLKMPRGGHAQVGVYDVAGRLVKKLVDRPLAAGLHRLHWDNTNSRNTAVSSGVYFYRYNLVGDSGTGRIVVVR